MVTGYADVDQAVVAMRNGAYDFIAKPFTLENMELTVERAFEVASLERENRSLRLSSISLEQPLIGQSQIMHQLMYLIEKVAPTDVPVLITGESGTGKDVVASAIHSGSQRSALPFVVKNCASLQPELARSELFGHVKGAFTNAVNSSEGLMTFANKGTLFLDEVGELSLEVQAQLLRVLESQRYRRVGEKEERRADVRFLFATNRNLSVEVQQGRFHEALFHRINVFQINLPALKERKDDIPLLVRHFLSQLSRGKGTYTLSEEVMRYLLQYDWPGNIRELRNVLERGIILSEQGLITENSLPAEFVASTPLIVGRRSGEISSKIAEELLPATASASLLGQELSKPNKEVESFVNPLQGNKKEDTLATILRLDDLEKEHILKILNLSGGNKHQAAQVLGISRKTLYRKLDKLGLP